MTIQRRSFLHSLFAVFLPIVGAGQPEQPPTGTQYFTLPDGHTAHLENPQAMQDGAGVVFLATRPNSGVGGLVWRQNPDGSTAIVLAINPDAMYGLGEFAVWPDGYLRYVTVEKVDHTRLVVIPVPGWTPIL